MSSAKEACSTVNTPMSVVMSFDVYEHSDLEPRESRSTYNQPCRRRGVCIVKDWKGHITMACSLLMLRLPVLFM